MPSESNCFNCNIPKSRGIAPVLHLHPPAAQDWPPLKSEQKPPPGRCRARQTPRHRTDGTIPASRRRNFRLPLLPHRRLAAPGWPQTPLSSRSFPHCRPASRMAQTRAAPGVTPTPGRPQDASRDPPWNLLGNSDSQLCGSLPPGGRRPSLHGDMSVSTTPTVKQNLTTPGHNFDTNLNSTHPNTSNEQPYHRDGTGRHIHKQRRIVPPTGRPDLSLHAQPRVASRPR